MVRVLITGAGGLLGSRLAEAFSKGGHEVYSGYFRNEPARGIPLRFDLCDEAGIGAAFERAKPDVVVHAAAITNVDECESNRELARRVNALATRGLAKRSKSHGAFLIYVSSDYVFDGAKGMYDEGDPPNPINYYGVTKLEGERHVSEVLRDYCIVRPSVIYGAIPASGKANFALWVIEGLRAGKPIGAVVDQWVSPTLNTNLAEMILEVAERGLTGVYHLAGASRVSRYEFAKLIAEAFGFDPGLIKPVAMEGMGWIAKRPRDSSLSVRRAMGDLRTKPLGIGRALERLRMEMAQRPEGARA